MKKKSVLLLKKINFYPFANSFNYFPEIKKLRGKGKFKLKNKMGHDITATFLGEDVAYLCRSGFGNPLRHTIYRALQCEDYNNGVSGNGGSKTFYKIQIKDALDELPLHVSTIDYADKGDMRTDIDEDFYKPEKEFLKKILKYLTKNKQESIKIRFE